MDIKSAPEVSGIASPETFLLDLFGSQPLASGVSVTPTTAMQCTAVSCAVGETKAALGVDDAGVISGLAWPFGSPDRVGDMIEKGAFAGVSLPVPMLFGHDPNQPVGAWDHAVETDEGLEVRGRLLVEHVERAREVRALVQSGAVGGLSIGFSTKKQAPRRGGRTISALDLVEISLVSVPMHPAARVRSAKQTSSAIAFAEALHRAAMALRT